MVSSIRAQKSQTLCFCFYFLFFFSFQSSIGSVFFSFRSFLFFICVAAPGFRPQFAWNLCGIFLAHFFRTDAHWCRLLTNPPKNHESWRNFTISSWHFDIMRFHVFKKILKKKKTCCFLGILLRWHPFFLLENVETIWSPDYWLRISHVSRNIYIYIYIVYIYIFFLAIADILFLCSR